MIAGVFQNCPSQFKLNLTVRNDRLFCVFAVHKKMETSLDFFRNELEGSEETTNIFFNGHSIGQTYK